MKKQHDHSQSELNWQSLGPKRICYVARAWREQEEFTGQGWYCRKMVSQEVVMGAMNLRSSLSL